MSLGEQKCATGFAEQGPIIGIAGIVAQKFAEPSRTLPKPLGKFIEGQDVGHAALTP
jgi:hypothetical protein